jgi:predicted acylesterase/phospholipase RssA
MKLRDLLCLPKKPKKSFGARECNEQERRDYVVRKAGLITSVIAVVVSILWWYSGVEIRMVSIFFISTWILWLFVSYTARGHQLSPTYNPDEKFRFPVFLVSGFVGVLVALVLLIVNVGERVWFTSDRTLAYAYKAFLLVIAFVSCFPIVRILLKQTRKLKTRPWLLIGYGMGVIPLIMGWLIWSLSWWLFRPGNLFEAKHQVSAEECLSEISRPIEEKTTNQNRSRVAVALSGGGYRAALIHAGLLSVLDEKGISINILTTVSGGSIIGAAYASGISPTTFAASLCRTKPGLLTDLSSIGSMVLEMFWPSGGWTPTYASHFRRVFYGDKKLGDLSEPPKLLVNVTDMEAKRPEAREILFKDASRVINEASLADIVTASAAFPGPFQPTHLRWGEKKDIKDIKDTKEEKEEIRRFSDGGVIENLGLEGLRKYIAKTTGSARESTWPDVLIISDASGHGDPKSLRPKVDLISLYSGALDISFELLHRLLYRVFTGHGNVLNLLDTNVEKQLGCVTFEDLLGNSQSSLQSKRLISVTIPATAEAMEKFLSRYSERIGDLEGLSIDKIQARVRKFRTLDELSPAEVRQAFWLGRGLGEIYMPAIEEAIKHQATSCETILKSAIQGVPDGKSGDR